MMDSSTKLLPVRGRMPILSGSPFTMSLGRSQKNRYAAIPWSPQRNKVALIKCQYSNSTPGMKRDIY